MRVAILAGGYGTRLQEETTIRPKPMVEIGGMPIMWHIMKHFTTHECNDFYIALGYMGDFIKRYFLDWYSLSGHLSIDFASGEIHRDQRPYESWKVNAIDTGKDTLTGGRINRLQNWLKDDTFIVTYGDGVSDVDVNKLIEFHKSHGLIATVTAVRPPARFGGLLFDGDRVTKFTEKPQAGEGWINGGFLVFEPAVFDYLSGDGDSLEANALEKIAADNQLAAYKHDGFWQCMDTLRDKTYLEKLWQQGNAPWKTWE